MNKNVKKISVIIFAWILICSTLITNAAVVSDNDGSAFITKQQFMDLQTELSKIIDTYNVSLSNKIDGVIANYLAGIKLQLKSTRRKIINDSDHWLMYNISDYPTYVEGYPYLSGYTMCGYYNNNHSAYGNTMRFCSWFGVDYNGNSDYRTNPSFKRHIVSRPSKNSTKNGNNDYVAEWKGFYINEGDFISLGVYDEHIGGTDWVSNNMNYIKLETPQTFAYASCPVYCTNISVQNSSRTHYIKSKITCSAAQRINGDISGDTYVSIYKDIEDNRFWEENIANIVGITPTTPAITYQYTGADMTSWFTTVVPSSSLKIAGSYKRYSGGQYYNYNDSTTLWNFASQYSITSYGVNGSSPFRLIKLANDPNNLQFKRLWSGKTDSIAQVLNDKYENSNTPAADKATIKAALLWDKDNVPHLSMGAGYPFLEVSYDEEVKFDFKIKESGSYRVYAKYGPFSPTGNAATEADVTFDISSGGTTTHSTTLPVTGGVDTKMKFKVTKDGTNYIFLKWCDTTTNKSGTLDLSNDPIVLPAI